MITETGAKTLDEQANFDVAVVGAGPAGLLAGLACAAAGLRTAVIGPLADRQDGRTAALLDGSINILKRLDVWERVAPASEPLTDIRLVDASEALIRAPEVHFRASEIGLAAFGYNVPNAALTEALEAASSPCLTRLVGRGVMAFDLGADRVTLATAEGRTVTTRLAVAADGRTSPTRTAAGIAVSSWSYPQSAVVTTFAHSRPHRGVSTELHRPVGPLTVVPGPGNTSNLVWVDRPSEAERLLALDDEAFRRELTGRLGGLLGTLSDFSPRRAYLLTGQTAAPLGRNRIALVGEAGHTMPPIGAQGLNLGFRDAATIAELAGEAKAAGQDVGAAALLERYDRLRKADVVTRVYAVDILNRSLLSSIPGVHFARGLGLFALASSPHLRASVMREGVMPTAARPALMQPFDLNVETRPERLDVAAP
jgi:2-octaprenyl-6-methoxyphenol hydroxylase